MSENNLREIRPVMVSEADFDLFDFKFRIMCALQDQTIGERISELIRTDINLSEADYFNEEWISQADLIDELEKAGKTISRQTLRNHRKNGNLPADYFVESKIEDDQPNAAKNQRTYYRKDKCFKFYGIDPNNGEK